MGAPLLTPPPNATPRFFQEFAPLFAQLSLWNRKFAAALERVQGVSLQKITASDEGMVVLGVYKPGDDRSSVLLSLRRSDAGIQTTRTKPPSQSKPNSFVQLARKYLLGRKVAYSYLNLSPLVVVLEIGPPTPAALAETPELAEGPDTLLLDLEARPARLILARRWNQVPERYRTTVSAFPTGRDFFESFCEWTLEQTKTKRRPAFDVPFELTYCPLSERVNDAPAVESSTSPQTTAPLETAPLETTPAPSAADTASHGGAAPVTTIATVAQALAVLPPHVRRPAKTRLQFLARRIGKQKGDLPSEESLSRLNARAEGLRAHLYLWPKNSPVWHVPRELIEDFGLPAVMQLKHGQSPGDLLSDAFAETEKLKRRREELSQRVVESEASLERFENLVLAAAQDVAALPPEKAQYAPPETARMLCAQLDVSWTLGGERQRRDEEVASRRLPYRTFQATSGEFIRVAKSAQDGDRMLRLMPTNHYWLHVLTGEGSHVWLEKPRGSHKPSPTAVREAAILAVHFSRQGRGQSAEVRVATRGDVDKRKDLPVGKVLVRRAETLLIRYDDSELAPLLGNA